MPVGRLPRQHIRSLKVAVIRHSPRAVPGDADSDGRVVDGGVTRASCRLQGMRSIPSHASSATGRCRHRACWPDGLPSLPVPMAGTPEHRRSHWVIKVSNWKSAALPAVMSTPELRPQLRQQSANASSFNPAARHRSGCERGRSDRMDNRPILLPDCTHTGGGDGRQRMCSPQADL